MVYLLYDISSSHYHGHNSGRDRAVPDLQLGPQRYRAIAFGLAHQSKRPVLFDISRSDPRGNGVGIFNNILERLGENNKRHGAVGERARA